MKTDLSVARLRELLHYNPETGVFTWIKRSSPASRVLIGSEAGRVNKDGYREVRIDGNLYLAHRLAWFYSYGVWPGTKLDHKSGIRDYNKLDNLRNVTDIQNSQNRGLRIDNKSGVPGVHWCQHISKWSSRITVNKAKIVLGYFSDFEEAVSARRQAEVKYFGEFRRLA